MTNKKSFKLGARGIDGLLGITEDIPKKEKGEFGHKTFHMNLSNYDKLSSVAFWERRTLGELVDEIFTSYICEYEKKNGAIELRPEKKPRKRKGTL